MERHVIPGLLAVKTVRYLVVLFVTRYAEFSIPRFDARATRLCTWWVRSYIAPGGALMPLGRRWFQSASAGGSILYLGDWQGGTGVFIPLPAAGIRCLVSILAGVWCDMPAILLSALRGNKRSIAAARHGAR